MAFRGSTDIQKCFATIYIMMINYNIFSNIRNINLIIDIMIFNLFPYPLFTE